MKIKNSDLTFTLASKSPRRAELLRNLGIDPVIFPVDLDESLSDAFALCDMVKSLALSKARSAALFVENSVIIGADTLVSFNGKVYGKPRDEAAAVEMLSALSGEWHEVYTGIAVINKLKDGLDHTAEEIVEYELTRVHFSVTDSDTIKRYIATGEPFDKAGAYGIQGMGSILVDRIEGDYFNVMGLPIHRLSRILKNEIGYYII